MKKLVFLVFLFSCFSVLLPNTAFAALDIEWESGDLTGVAIGSSEEASYVVENKNFLCDIEILEVYRAGDTDVFTVSNIPDCLRPRFEPEESGEESIPGYILKPGERCSGLSVSFSPDEVRWFNTELTVRYRDQGSSPPCNTNEQTEIELVPGQGGDATSSQPPSGSSANASFNYTPLEPIPGFESTDTSTLEGFLRGLYLFVMWTVGIAAMFMIMIGGFWYLTSAGNTSRTGEAKKIITNALIGLLVALVTWLLLYVINPDFVNVDLRSLEDIIINSGERTYSRYPSVGPGHGPGNGACEPVPSGVCSVESLKATCLGGNADVFSNICNVESNGDPLRFSEVDLCRDGAPFSVGLFQINLTVHRIGGLNCPAAFSDKNYDCTVINESLYNECVAVAQDPTTNLNKACQLSQNGSNVGPWKNTAEKCGFL